MLCWSLQNNGWPNRRVAHINRQQHRRLSVSGDANRQYHNCALFLRYFWLKWTTPSRCLSGCGSIIVRNPRDDAGRTHVSIPPRQGLGGKGTNRGITVISLVITAAFL